MFYVLNEDGKPVYEPDLLKAARWFETADRGVAREETNGIVISTVFLGLDHGFDSARPVLWETMVFDKAGRDCYCCRYVTREAALAGHDQACAMVRDGKLPPPQKGI